MVSRINKTGLFSNRRLQLGAVALLVGTTALALRLWLLIRYPFDGLYGQDAYYYLTSTQRLAAIWTDPDLLSYWLTSAGTPPVSEWPLGYNAQMALMSIVTGLNGASGQIVSLVAGTLTPVWTALILLVAWQSAQDTQSQGPLPYHVLVGAAFAGMLVALSVLSVRASLVVMSDMAGAHWATLGVLTSLYYGRDPSHRLKWGLFAGACIGLACLTRYIYPLLLLPVTLSLLGSVLSWAGPRDKPGKLTNRALRQISPVILPAICLLGLQLVHNMIHPLSTSVSPVIAQWAPANALQRVFDTSDGRLTYPTTMAEFFLVGPLTSFNGLGPWMLPWFLLGMIALIRQRAYSAILILVSWWLTFALFYSGNTYQAGRFILSYLPPMAVIAGLGLTSAVRSVQAAYRDYLRRNMRSCLALAGFLLLAVLGLLTGFGVVSTMRNTVADFRGLYLSKEDNLAAIQCLNAQLANQPLKLPTLTFGITLAVREYTKLTPRELYDETPTTADAILRPKGLTVARLGYLALPQAGFEEQWGKTNLGNLYHHLQDDYRLVPIACPDTSESIFEIENR